MTLHAQEFPAGLSRSLARMLLSTQLHRRANIFGFLKYVGKIFTSWMGSHFIVLPVVWINVTVNTMNGTNRCNNDNSLAQHWPRGLRNMLLVYLRIHFLYRMRG